MVIEDESLLLQAISKKLDAVGFEGVLCLNAKEAIKYLQGSGELPDVIWLDYYLPDMSGFEFLSEIRRNERWKKIPVVVVSNSASEKKKSAMLALGVKKYILKAEYKLSDIVEIIKEIIQGDSPQI
jgi:CheY-like chemotaxis protein